MAILEGASLSGDEVASLQFLPPWSLRGDTVNYGLGLLSCFSISDLPSVISDGFLYIFDPQGVVIATSTTHSPSAKVFPLRGIYVSCDLMHVFALFSCLDGPCKVH